MRKATRMTASAVVGGLGLLCVSVLPVAAQSGVELRPVTHIASVASGSIQGVVQDENGGMHPRGSEYQTLVVVDGVPM